MASDRFGARRHAAGFAGLLLLWPALAMGQPDEATKDSARELGREGVRRYEAGDWEGARQLFRQAYRLVPAPTLALREARALVKLNRLVEAAEAYERAAMTPVVANTPDAFRQAIAAAHVELDALRPRIPRLRITVKGEGARSRDLVVRLNGVDVSTAVLGVERPVDPGMHHVQVVAPGARPDSETVTLREAETRTVELEIARGAPVATHPVAPLKPEQDVRGDGSSLPRTLGWVGLGLGATGLAVGVATGIMALDKKSSLDDACSGTRCPRSAADDLEAFRTLRTVSTVGYISGGVLGAAGLTLLLTSSRSEPKRQTGVAGAEPWVGAGSAGVRGRF